MIPGACPDCGAIRPLADYLQQKVQQKPERDPWADITPSRLSSSCDRYRPR